MNIRVLDGGCSVWAVADIVFPFQSRPLALRQPVELTNVNTRILSIRSATQQNFYQAKALIPSFKPVTLDGTIGPKT
jgi:hypothetical protein